MDGEDFRVNNLEARNKGSHVTLRNVNKTYGTEPDAVEAVRSATFEVSYGDFLTILGPSGCGKSTLLLLIAGLIPISNGEILMEGEPITKPRRDLGMVFQSPVLMPWRSVLDNILFPIDVLKLKRTEYIPEAMKLIETTGLSGFQDKLPMELSGGMQQRVSICRALIHNPSLLLMDEPFSALDALTRDEMNIELLRIWEKYKKTVIFVTHSIREAIFLSDNVLVMSRRPSIIMDNFRIDFPRPRSIEIQEAKEFNEYVAELRNAIIRSHEG